MLTGCEPEELPHEGLALDVRKAVPAGTSKALVRALEAMLEPDPDRRATSIEEALAQVEESKAEAPPKRKKRRREEKRARREERRGRPAPIFARIFARLGLLIALLTVWLTVGVAVPIVLIVLSLFFGQRLRDAAKACVNAAKRAHAAIGRASARLSGRVVEPPKLRVAADGDRMRVAAPEEAWLEETLESEQRRDEEERRWRDQMKRHSQRKHWGR
jgi:hypothetical protein